MKIEISNRDCIEGMRDLSARSMDAIVTSPPYNLGIHYRSYEDRRERADYLSWCATWVREVRRVLREDGSFFLNLGASSTDPLLPHEVLLKAVACDFKLQNTIHWIKSISISDACGAVTSRGHFKPINSKALLNNCHEYVFHLTGSGKIAIDRLAIGVPYTDKSNIGRWQHTCGKDRRCRGNNWFIPYQTIRSRTHQRPHPAMFPEALAEMCLRLHGRSNMSVMDPFLGLGSTAVAAQRVGAARLVGFEIDEKYAAYARERLSDGAQ